MGLATVKTDVMVLKLKAGVLKSKATRDVKNGATNLINARTVYNSVNH